MSGGQWDLKVVRYKMPRTGVWDEQPYTQFNSMEKEMAAVYTDKAELVKDS